jgi:hypothetical protein
VGGYDEELEALPEEAPAEPAAPGDPFADLEESLHQRLVERVRKRVERELDQEKVQQALAPTDAPNDTIVKQAAARPYRAALRTLVATSGRPQDLVARIAKLNDELGIFVPRSVYLVALKVGAMGNAQEYLRRCVALMGHEPTPSEAKTLVRLGSLLAAHKSRSKQTNTP